MRRICTGFFCVAAAIACGGAGAQEGAQDFAGQSLSTRTRAEVVAELERARAAGELENRGQSYGSFDPQAIKSTRSRSEVLAELDVARRAQALDIRNHGASYGSFPIGEIRSTLSRGAVIAETLAAQQAQGPLSRGERGGS